MQWQVQHQTAGGLQQDSEPDPELAPHAVLQPQQLPEQLPLPLQDQQPPAGASEHDVDLELGQESPLPSVGWQPENGLDLGAAGGESGKDGGAGELLEADDDGGGEGLAQDPQTAELQYQHHLQLLQQQEGAGGMQYVQNQNGQMVPWQGGEDGENGGDTAVLQRLQTSVIKRRNALVQLYKQGLRRPPKRSKAVSGADDKDDQVACSAQRCRHAAASAWNAHAR